MPNYKRERDHDSKTNPDIQIGFNSKLEFKKIS